MQRGCDCRQSLRMPLVLPGLSTGQGPHGSAILRMPRRAAAHASRSQRSSLRYSFQQQLRCTHSNPSGSAVPKGLATVREVSPLGRLAVRRLCEPGRGLVSCRIFRVSFAAPTEQGRNYTLPPLRSGNVCARRPPGSSLALGSGPSPCGSGPKKRCMGQVARDATRCG